MLDAKTLTVTLILVLVIGCALHFVNWRVHRDSRGVKWWAIGLAMHTIGVALSSWENAREVHGALEVIAFNSVSLGGLVIVLFGTSQFAGRPLPAPVYLFLASSTVLGLGWFSIIDPSLTSRIVLYSTILAMCSAITIYLLWWVAKRDGALGVVVLATSSACSVLLIPVLVDQQLTAQSELVSLYDNSPTVVAGLLTLIACETTAMFGYLMLSANYSQAQLHGLAMTDSLTGIPNRRAFERVVEDRVELARSRGESIGLALLDLDHFKQVNDRFGHDAGDQVLKEVANLAQRELVGEGFVARVGGEEFAVVFEREDQARIEYLLDALRDRISALEILADGKPITVTTSVGLTVMPVSSSVEVADLLRAADEALYAAKAAGRNRVVMHTTDATTGVQHASASNMLGAA